MRVAHVITRLIIGGAQENTVLNCQELIREDGDDVLLVTGPGLGPEGSLEADARSRGVPLAVIDALRRNISPVRDRHAWQAIRYELQKFRPDVVHTHSGKAGLFGRVIASRLSVPLIVHTVHGAPFHRYQNWIARDFFRRCERFAAAHCHAIISVADAMTDQLVEARIAPPEKFTTIYSGMEVDPFLNADQYRKEVRRELGYCDDQIVVGKVARLFHLKGHADLVAAAALACRESPQLQFLLIGDGILRRQLEAQIAAVGLVDRFRFTGLVPPDRIARLLAATDLIVHGSYREGLARVLPQALLVGRPVISYDIDGAREVVRDGDTGFLVPPADISALADRITRLARSPELREQLAANGRELCRARFDHRQMTQQIRQLYQQLLAANPTRTPDRRAVH